MPLAVPDALAASLNVKAGPLTRPTAVQLVSQYLADLRERGGGRGLSGIVHSPKGVMAAEQGTQLAEVLLPRDVRQRIERRGPQASRSFPTGAAPASVRGPAARGGRLAAVRDRRLSSDRLCAIGHDFDESQVASGRLIRCSRPKCSPRVIPIIPREIRSPKERAAAAPAAAVARDAFLELGGRLPLLPGTSKECARIAAAFPADRVKRLEWDTATEANVRAAIAGCKYIHLAAHGLVDSQHDNFYGAIALTPGLAAERSFDNDGFLLFNEIHALPLSGCELVVLSACQTNVGPDRPLEAGSTLAQAFLGAGGRRVVCSHWNVDDASTAELMGTFFEAIAKADRSGAKSTTPQHFKKPASRSAPIGNGRRPITGPPSYSSARLIKMDAWLSCEPPTASFTG